MLFLLPTGFTQPNQLVMIDDARVPAERDHERSEVTRDLDERGCVTPNPHDEPRHVGDRRPRRFARSGASCAARPSPRRPRRAARAARGKARTGARGCVTRPSCARRAARAPRGRRARARPPARPRGAWNPLRRRRDGLLRDALRERSGAERPVVPQDLADAPREAEGRELEGRAEEGVRRGTFGLSDLSLRRTRLEPRAIPARQRGAERVAELGEAGARSLEADARGGGVADFHAGAAERARGVRRPRARAGDRRSRRIAGASSASSAASSGRPASSATSARKVSARVRPKTSPDARGEPLLLLQVAAGAIEIAERERRGAELAVGDRFADRVAEATRELGRVLEQRLRRAERAEDDVERAERVEDLRALVEERRCDVRAR